MNSQKLYKFFYLSLKDMEPMMPLVLVQPKQERPSVFSSTGAVVGSSAASAVIAAAAGSNSSVAPAVFSVPSPVVISPPPQLLDQKPRYGTVFSIVSIFLISV